MSEIANGNVSDSHVGVKSYLDELYSSSSRNFANLMAFVVDILHNFFKEKPPRSRLLDIGCGPKIHPVISASNCIQGIYLGNINIQNVELLSLWLKGELEIQNLIVQRVCTLEQKGQSADKRIAQIKEKVKDLLLIDILSLNLKSLRGSECNIPRTYDVITSCFSLDVICQSKYQYVQAVQNIHSLLESGGYFILVGGMNTGSTKHFIDNDPKWPHLTSAELYYIFDEAGFDVQVLRECPFDGTDLKMFVMIAQKIA